MMRIVPTTKPGLMRRKRSGRPGPSMCWGLAVFLILIVGGYIIAMNVLAPLVDSMPFPDLGISFPILFLFFMGIVIALAAFALVKGGRAYDKQFETFEERDPSICKRIIKDGPDGVELVISGDRNMTFAQACRLNWPFQSIAKKSSWFIQDERGNDVTESTLESTEGIFTLVPSYGSDIQKDETEKTDEYSSIHDGVEYYD